MKNRKTITRYLFFFILALVFVVGAYCYINKERVLGTVSESTNEQTDSNSGNTASSSQSNNYSHEPIHTSENKREDFGLKTISTFQEFEYLKNREGLKTFFVLGQTGCHFCEMYTPVLKEVAAVYKIEVVYINIKEFSEEDYESMMASELSIPKSCSKTGEETPLANGFSTPLSLFVEDGKSYACIRGYKDKTNLVKELKRIGYIN